MTTEIYLTAAFSMYTAFILVVIRVIFDNLLIFSFGIHEKIQWATNKNDRTATDS